MTMLDKFLKESGIGKSSLASYRRDLLQLSDYFSQCPEGASEEALRGYFADCANRLSPATLSRKLSVARSFYDFLEREKQVEVNPMTAIHAKDFEEKSIITLNRQELENLVSFPSGGLRGLRDRAMLAVLGETGLRVSELVMLNREDMKNGRCLLVGTGKRRRVLTLSAQAWEYLTAYEAVSRLYLEKEGSAEPLFITALGKRLTRQGFWKNIKDRALMCGIDKPISPQMLRRSLAQILSREGVDAKSLTALLGNAAPASLRVYQIQKKEV